MIMVFFMSDAQIHKTEAMPTHFALHGVNAIGQVVVLMVSSQGVGQLSVGHIGSL